MAYSIYTGRFDATIMATEIPALGIFERFALWRRMRRYRKGVGDLKAKVAALIACEEAPQPSKLQGRFGDTVATVLIDHSGSLNRFRNAETCLCISETLILALDQLGIRHEILGFTTDSWHGGNSRQLWLQNGEPKNPGRLCDLLHIIYRSHDDAAQSPPEELSNLLVPFLLKENIDGEALEWAEARLQNRAEKRKILFHISDGAPVDDSTILANSPAYLVDHLTSTIKRLEANDDIELYGMGVHHRVDEYFSCSIQAENIDDIPRDVVGFLVPILFDDA